MEICEPTFSEESKTDEKCSQVPMVVDDEPEQQWTNHSNGRKREAPCRLLENHQSIQDMDITSEEAPSTSAGFSYLCGIIIDGKEERETDVEKWQPIKQHFEQQNSTFEFEWPFEEICRNYLSKNGCVKKHCKFPHANTSEIPKLVSASFKTFNQMVIPQFGLKWIATLDTISLDGHLFIHLNNYEFDNETLDSISQHINRCTLSPLDTPPGLGELVLAKFNLTYYRARVLELFPKQAELFLIDFGHIILNPLHELRVLEKRWLHYPAQALACYIYNVQLIQTQENLKQIQKRYANRCFQVIFVKADEMEHKYWIRLEDVENDSFDVGKAFVELGIANNILDEPERKNSRRIIFIPG